MTNSWDDMRKGKEGSYFERKNREALERLAEKQTVKVLLSPVSGEPMKQEVLHGVVIDRCPTSGGVWLDAGELEHLLEVAAKHEEAPAGISGFFKGLAGK